MADEHEGFNVRKCILFTERMALISTEMGLTQKDLWYIMNHMMASFLVRTNANMEESMKTLILMVRAMRSGKAGS